MNKVIRLSESDLISIINKVISEQMDSRMPGQIETFGFKQGKPETLRPALEKQKEYFKSIDPHVALPILGIAVAFVPLIGPFLSAGVGLADAALYEKEGDTKTAGMVAMFSLLPGVGSLIPKIPGIKQLGAKGMAALAPKLTKGGSQLTKIESEVVQGISDNLPLVQQELNTYVKKVATEGAKKVANPTTGQVLTNLAKQGVVGVTRAVAPFVAAGAAYSKGYDTVQSNTPRIKAEKEGLEWEFVRTTFGSSGSQQDNVLLTKAWDKGWRPGIIVPKEFRTQKYQNELDQEEKNLEQLNGLLAQARGSQQQK
jgi:hypothetical protein